MHRLRTPLRALVLAGAFPAALLAQGEPARIDTTLTLERGGQVHLGIVSGEIRVTGSDRRDVKISATIDLGRFELTTTSGRIALQTRSVRNRQGPATVIVEVPVGTRVSASGVSGDIEVRATQAEVIARSVSGGVEIRGARGRADVESVSGVVALRDAQGDLQVESVSGDVTVEDASGALDVESVSGSIRVRRSRLSELSAETVSGSVSYQGALTATAEVEISTHSGDVTLTLPANVGATLELGTFSGRINSEFPLTLQPGQQGGRGRRMEFTLGNGGARVAAEAFSGNITIRRGGAAGDQE